MTHNNVDILISGAGIAGLSAAAAFGAAGFAVLCVDPTPPVTTRDADGADLRSTALLQPARDVLSQAGIWDALAPFGTPLQVMRIIDAGGEHPEPRVQQDFDAAEISDLPFGWNFPNWLLRRELLTLLETLPNVEFCPGIATTGLFSRTSSARVRLSDGRKVQARLVIAADGRNSAIRDAAGISARKTRYRQKALAFAVTHDIPHNNVSTEIHRTGGPFTLVPLPDHNGSPSSAVVWMEDASIADDLVAKDIPEFEAEMTERSCAVLGDLKLASKRAIWPIISQRATTLTAQRVALIAEAAHVIPPIGAQGLNMSLQDLSALLDLAKAAPDDLGSPEMLQTYEKKRSADIKLRVTGIDALNRISQASSPAMRDIRAAGIRTLQKAAPIRQSLMRLGLGAR